MEKESIGMKLVGKKEDYLNLAKDKKLLSMIWDWVERIVEKEKKQYLQWAIISMKDNLGTPNWKEAKEELLYYGPDNFQLELPRNKQEQIKIYWWKLVKYQYNTLKENKEI